MTTEEAKAGTKPQGKRLMRMGYALWQDPMVRDPHNAYQLLCGDPECPQKDWRHRPRTYDCTGHQFCHGEPLAAVPAEWTELPEAKTVGPLVAGPLPKEVREANSAHGWFGHDTAVPEGRKVVATLDTVEAWIAAHYGLTVEQVPRAKGLPLWVYEWRKKARFGAGAQGKGRPRGSSVTQQQPEEHAGAALSVSHVCTYQPSPTKFGLLSYPKDMAVKTIIDTKVKEEKQPQTNKRTLTKSGTITSQNSSSQNFQFMESSKVSPKHRRANTKDLGTGSEYPGYWNHNDGYKNNSLNRYIQNRMNSDQLQFMDHSEIEKIAKKKQLKGANVPNGQANEIPGASTEKKKNKPAKSGRKLIPDQLIKVHDHPAKLIAQTAKNTIAAAKKREQLAADIKENLTQFTHPMRSLNKTHYNISELVKMKDIQSTSELSSTQHVAASRNRIFSANNSRKLKKTVDYASQHQLNNTHSDLRGHSRAQSAINSSFKALNQNPNSMRGSGATPHHVSSTRHDSYTDTQSKMNNMAGLTQKPSRNSPMSTDKNFQTVNFRSRQLTTQMQVSTDQFHFDNELKTSHAQIRNTIDRNFQSTKNFNQNSRQPTPKLSMTKQNMARAGYQGHAPQQLSFPPEESPRILTQINLSDLNLSPSQMNKKWEKQERFRKSPAMAKSLDKIKLSLSTNARIQNEKVTTQILNEQKNLQEVLSGKFQVECSEVAVPVYAKIENMRSVTRQERLEYERQQQAEKSAHTVHAKASQLQVDGDVEGQNDKPEHLVDELNEADGQMHLSGLDTKDETQGAHTNSIAASKQNGAATSSTPIKYSVQIIKNQFGQACGSRGHKNNVRTHHDIQADPASPEELKESTTQLIRNKILRELNESIFHCQSQKLENSSAEEVNLELKFYTLDLTIDKIYHDWKDFNFWVQQSQIRKKHPQDWESQLDYLGTGLRELPLNLMLLYNYGCALERLGRYDQAIRFFQYAEEIKPRWSEACFGMAVTYFKLQDYKQSKKMVKIAIKQFKYGAIYDSENEMIYFKAMCYKKLKRYNLAQRDYQQIAEIFKKEEGDRLLHHVVTVILLTLNENRYYQHDQMEQILSLIKAFTKCYPQEESKKLKRWTNENPPGEKEDIKFSPDGYLNMETYGLLICKILENAPFFNRFGRENLLKYLAGAQVEYYNAEDILFLQDRIGVITHGSVRVKSHQQGIMTPYTIGRYSKGQILGHGQSDNNITTNPQTWFTCFDDNTEIVFFDQKTFNKLWSLQCLNSNHMIMMNMIKSNSMFKGMSEQTIYHLVFDKIQIRKYRPGQMICRMSKRSFLNRKVYGRFYVQTKSSVQEQLELVKMSNVMKSAQEAQPEKQSESVVSSFVQSLTKKSAPARKGTIESYNTTIAIEEEIINSDLGPGLAAKKLRMNASIEPIEESKGEQLKSNSTIVNDKAPEVNLAPANAIVERLSKKDKEPKLDYKDFDEFFQMINFMYNDIRYQEADGIYLIYSGNVDLVDTSKKKFLHTLGMDECFGDAKVREKISYEYLGDLYAGLYPRRARDDARTKLLGTKGIPNPYAQKKVEGALQKEPKTKMHVHTVVKTEDVHEVVFSDEECTLCIFIPYYKFFESVPFNELQAVRESYENKNQIKQVVHLVASHYGAKVHELFKY